MPYHLFGGHLMVNLGWEMLPSHQCDSWLECAGRIRTHMDTYWQLYVDISENSGTPKSSTLIGFSIINHPFWGTPIFGNTHVAIWSPDWICDGLWLFHQNTCNDELGVAQQEYCSIKLANENFPYHIYQIRTRRNNLIFHHPVGSFWTIIFQTSMTFRFMCAGTIRCMLIQP